MATAEHIQQLEAKKTEVKSSVEKDATKNAHHRLKILTAKRGGKFKISEKQFQEELEMAWIGGEFSSAERILRCLELDEDLSTRDLCIGEAHNFVIDLYKVLKKKLGLKDELGLEDILTGGKYATQMIEKPYLETPTDADIFVNMVKENRVQ